MKQIIAVFLSCALLLAQPVMADELTKVRNIVDKNVKIFIGYVADKNMDKEVKKQKLIETIEPFFDFQTMALICLVKKHRKELSKVKGRRQEFVDVFVKRLQDSYLEKMDLYTDETVEVGEAKKVKKNIHVVTNLVGKDGKIEIIYKFRKTKKGWLVYDLEILGVSIVQTYRSQFASFLKNNTIEDLLVSLKTTDTFKMPEDKKQ